MLKVERRGDGKSLASSSTVCVWCHANEVIDKSMGHHH